MSVLSCPVPLCCVVVIPHWKKYFCKSDKQELGTGVSTFAAETESTTELNQGLLKIEIKVTRDDFVQGLKICNFNDRNFNTDTDPFYNCKMYTIFKRKTG